MGRGGVYPRRMPLAPTVKAASLIAALAVLSLGSGCVTINVYPNGPQPTAAGGPLQGQGQPGALGYSPGSPGMTAPGAPMGQPGAQTRSIDTTWSPGPTSQTPYPRGAGDAWGPPRTAPPGCVAPCTTQGRAIGNDL